MTGVRLRWRTPISALSGLVVGAAVGLALQLNFHELSSDGYFLYRDPESEWYKVVAAILVCIAVGVYFVSKGHVNEARTGSFSFLAGLLVIVGWKMAVGRVVGGNLWMIGLPMFAIPAAATLGVCLCLAQRSIERKTRSSS